MYFNQIWIWNANVKSPGLVKSPGPSSMVSEIEMIISAGIGLLPYDT